MICRWYQGDCRLNSNDSIQGNVNKVESRRTGTRFLLHHRPTEARCQASPGLLPWAVCYEIIDEPGFGGGADEEIEPTREAAPDVLLGNPVGKLIDQHGRVLTSFQAASYDNPPTGHKPFCCAEPVTALKLNALFRNQLLQSCCIFGRISLRTGELRQWFTSLAALSTDTRTAGYTEVNLQSHHPMRVFP